MTCRMTTISIVVVCIGFRSRPARGARIETEDAVLIMLFDKDELRARLSVGARILDLQTAVSARVVELEADLTESRTLKLQMPL